MKYLYIVVEKDDENAIAAFDTLADAEEYIYTISEEETYETMTIANPVDVFGFPVWNYKIDYKWLIQDCLSSFLINKIPYLKENIKNEM